MVVMHVRCAECRTTISIPDEVRKRGGGFRCPHCGWQGSLTGRARALRKKSRGPAATHWAARGGRRTIDQRPSFVLGLVLGLVPVSFAFPVVGVTLALVLVGWAVAVLAGRRRRSALGFAMRMGSGRRRVQLVTAGVDVVLALAAVGVATVSFAAGREMDRRARERELAEQEALARAEAEREAEQARIRAEAPAVVEEVAGALDAVEKLIDDGDFDKAKLELDAAVARLAVFVELEPPPEEATELGPRIADVSSRLAAAREGLRAIARAEELIAQAGALTRQREFLKADELFTKAQAMLEIEPEVAAQLDVDVERRKRSMVRKRAWLAPRVEKARAEMERRAERERKRLAREQELARLAHERELARIEKERIEAEVRKRLEKWDKTLAERGSEVDFLHATVAVDGAKTLSEFRNRRVDPVEFPKRVLEPGDGGCYVIVRARERNVAGRIQFGVEDGGLGGVRYRLVNIMGGTYAPYRELADYALRQRGERKEHDVLPRRSWRFRLFFRAPADVDKHHLFLEATGKGPQGSARVARFRLF
jgi:hypothetical protein